MAANLKLAPPPRDPNRDALREAIARKAAAEAAFAANADTVMALRRRAYRAEESAEAAERTAEEIRKAWVRHLANPSGEPAPAMTLKEARDALADLQEQAQILRSASNAANAATPTCEIDLKYEAHRLNVAIANVVKAEADGVVRKLVGRHSQILGEMGAVMAVLRFLYGKGATAKELGGGGTSGLLDEAMLRMWNAAGGWGTPPALDKTILSTWNAAWDALSRDADARLPQ